MWVWLARDRAPRFFRHRRLQLDAEHVASEALALDQRGAGARERIDRPLAAPGVAAQQLVRDLRDEVAPVARVVRPRAVAPPDQPQAIGNDVVGAHLGHALQQPVGVVAGALERERRGDLVKLAQQE